MLQNEVLVMPTEEYRITDLSSFFAEDFKIRNTKFLLGTTHYDMNQYPSQDRIRHQIWVVRNQDLRRVLREFPTEEPLVDQCALWMHAIVGKHFFPDANHRTAIVLLRRLLRDNGIEPGEWSIERTKQARADSHEVRAELPPIRMDTLYERDELFELWRRYFKDVLPEHYK